MRLLPAFSILAVTFMVSCASLQTVSLDQLYPASVNFPNEVKNVAIVNNMLRTPHYRADQLNKGTLPGDGKLLSEAFASALADNGYFNQVVICDSALRSIDDRQIERFLAPGHVTRLLSSLQSDILLSAELMNVSVKHDKFYYPGIPDPFPILRVDVYSVVNAYIENRSRALFSVAVHDSLFWDIHAGVSDSLVMDEACRISAASQVSKIVPQWKNIDRVYFDGVCAELRDGAVCLRENDLNRAATTWTALYNRSSKGKLKVKSAFNMALVSELKGDVDAAIQWLEKANTYAKDSSEEKFLIIKYSDVLHLRRSDMSRLNLQMKRFN